MPNYNRRTEKGFGRETDTRDLPKPPLRRRTATALRVLAGAPATELEQDELYRVLKNSRRRHIVRALADGPTDLDALAPAIAAAENGQPTSDDRKAAYVSCYQVHLPALARAGVVAYDRPSGRVERGPEWAAVYWYLRVGERVAGGGGDGGGGS